MRADGWNRIPLIRMTNINLLPAAGHEPRRHRRRHRRRAVPRVQPSWSIDDRRLNFQFATEVAYEIKGGKKGRLFKNPTYTGITYEFWRSCDAVGDERSYVMLGTPELRQGRARPDRPRRACGPGRPVPRRPGRGRQVVGRSGGPVNDERAHDALALAERALAQAERAGATEAEALVMAEDAALTRFANSQIHQNVAETNAVINLRFVVGKRVGVASSGRTDEEGLRRLAEQRRGHRRRRRGAAGLGRPARARPRSSEVAAAYAPATADASPELRADGVRAVIAAADDGRRHRLRLVLDRHGDDGRRQLEGHPRRRDADRRPAADRVDGPGRRDRLRRAGRGRRDDASMPRPSAARRPTRHARPPTRSPSRPATTRSCSRSTPSSTCSTCSATSASRRSPSRRSAASSRSASASAATS